MSNINFKIGDPVIVKLNIKDPDLDIDIGGWQGRISEISDKEGLVCINWDTLTLKEMPESVIEECEDEGLDWSKMYLGKDDIELSQYRDKESDVENLVEFLQEKYFWSDSDFGEQGKRIQAVLDKAQTLNIDPFEAWFQYLQEAITLPFEAVISEWQENGPLKEGYEVQVLSLDTWDDLYGVLSTVKYGKRKYTMPICDLLPTDDTSANYQPLSGYALWFANR